MSSISQAERTKLEQEYEDLEKQRAELKEKAIAINRKLHGEEVKDCVFTSHDGAQVRLSELFGDKQDLIVVHNMGKGCRHCTLWADGFKGFVPHLEDRAAFVVVSPDDHTTQAEFHKSRGWNFRMLSAHGTSFFRDMGFEPEDGKPWPGVSTFRKGENGTITRVARDYFGPSDYYCSLWHFFDLLADGQNGWEPKYAY